jgi:hypothetical protein
MTNVSQEGLDDQCESGRLTLWRIFQKPLILSAACGGEQTRTDVLTLSARTHFLTSSNVVDSCRFAISECPVLVPLYHRIHEVISKVLLKVSSVQHLYGRTVALSR